MRWFKHLSFASEDETMTALITEFGAEGYGVYWLVLEKISTLMNGNNNTFVRYPTKKWLNICEISQKKFKNIIEFLANPENFRSKEPAFFIKIDEKYIEIDCPKLLKYRDEYTKKKKKISGQTPDKAPTESGQSKEQELELDTEEKQSKEEIEKELPQVVVLPSFFDNGSFKKTLQDFRDMRKASKSKMTLNAENLLIKKLVKLSNSNSDLAIKIMEQSIISSYRGVFELKNQDKLDKAKEPKKSENNPIKNPFWNVYHMKETIKDDKGHLLTLNIREMTDEEVETAIGFTHFMWLRWYCSECDKVYPVRYKSLPAKLKKRWDRIEGLIKEKINESIRG